jgi:flagellar basal body-associated protein FliL
MTAEKSERKAPGGGEEPATPAPQTSRLRAGIASLAKLFTKKWILILVLLTLVIHGLGFAYYRLRQESPPPRLSPEVALGAYRFEADRNEGGRVSRADFALHVAFIDGVDRAARQRLDDRKLRVQQDVEELLRRAHGGDFEDPGLQELKRQLQERINQTLGIRAVADVIVTDLRLQRSPRAGPSAASTAQSAPTDRPAK